VTASGARSRDCTRPPCQTKSWNLSWTTLLNLSATGWGSIEVVEADIDWDEPGEPKTDNRTVPVPPRLVGLLRRWIDEHGVRGRRSVVPYEERSAAGPSNWSRAMHRACRKVGHRPMRVYDCRHAAATTWLWAGVPLGEVARRLGHSVETLVSTYVGALQGDDVAANKLIDAALSTTRERIVVGERSSSRGEGQNGRETGFSR
jgi:Phage integrase family